VEGDLAGTLGYFPRSAPLVAVVSTDLESDQFRELDAIGRRRLGRDIESFLRSLASDIGLSWEKDVEPQLGGELVVGTTGVPCVEGAEGGLVVAFRAQDGDRIAGWDVLEPAGEASGARLFRDRQAASSSRSTATSSCSRATRTRSEARSPGPTRRGG
jgi:hypothetical protein